MTKEKKEISFEENLNKLEAIVKKLESGETPLDEAINEYTEAIKIAKICDEKLKNAEEQVNKVLSANGKLEEFKNLEDE